MDIKNHRPFKMDAFNVGTAPWVLRQVYLLNDAFISGGTLLGLYRDGDFIPGDTDIDVDIIGYDGIGEYLFRTLGHMDLIRTGYHNNRPMQTAFMYRGIIFDVWIFWREDSQLVNHNDMGVMKVPIKFFDNPSNLKTKYGNFNTPGPINDYLAFRYGPDWKTPQKSKGIYTNDF
jgi:hypothetical protein